jgi:hypothetical protein
MKQFVLAAALALAACGSATAPNGEANAAAPAANASANAAAPSANSAEASTDTVLRTETVAGIFTGWDMGDYLWANFTVPDREPIAAQPAMEAIGMFLDAHRGRQVTVEIATVRTVIPEAGGPTEIQRVTAARAGAADADSWWQSLSEADRATARRRFEDGALSGR